jgi:hypothetical protein
MSKIYITLTDRNHNEELDLRKKKLSTKQNISFFKVNEEGEVEGYQTTAFYYEESIISTYINVLEGKFKVNKKDGGFWSNYISKYDFDKFIKFSNKHGNVIILNETDNSTILSIYEDFKKEINILFNEKKELESRFKKLEIKDKNGRWKKIDYKNIIIFSSSQNGYTSNIKISDENKNISHAINNANYHNFKLIMEQHNYYSFYNFGTPNIVLKAGIKGTREYLDICKRITIKNKEIYTFVKTKLIDLFI